LNKEREPDLSILKSAVSSIAPNISNDTLVLCESTSFPGTLRNIIVPIIESLLPKNSNAIYYASAPERVNPGDSNWNQRNTPRLVGGISDEAAIKAVSFYESICNSVIRVSKPEIAEAAKLLENTFRLVNIALVNEFNQVCSVNDLDTNEVIKAASSKPYGFMPFKPGIGVGGHCIPVDPIYLKWWAQQSGVKTALIETADFVNHVMPRFVADKILSIVGESIKNPRILILGVAYKSGVADIRETPAAAVIDLLRAQGANVVWHDDLVGNWRGETSAPLSAHDIAVVVTNHDGVSDAAIKASKYVFDCTGTIAGADGI
jgi:UDP-N-acetyl-D-glucosamine dehydrogenase